MQKLVFLLVLFAIAYAAETCSETCARVCHSAACQYPCQQKCSSVAQPVEKPYFTLEHVQSFPPGTVITGSDAPAKVKGGLLYFTTLAGQIYRYNQTSDHMKVMYTVPRQSIDTSHDKGLYDIAMHRDYNSNGRVYIHYAAKPSADSEDIFADHDNVIAELEFSGIGFNFIREVKRIPQLSKERSGGWATMGLRQGILSGKAYLYVAVGGNKEEVAIRNEVTPELSTIYALADPDDPENEEEFVWASGVKNPLDCTASVFKAGRIQCLVEDLDHNRHVLSLHKGYNYGSEEFVQQCTGLACRQQRNQLLSKNALVTFESKECPVRSMQIYTGHDMRNYHSSVFLSRDACYDVEKQEFVGSEILRIYRDHYKATYKTIAMPTTMIDDMLVNTTLVGGDRLDQIYIAGYAVRSGETVLYRIVPTELARFWTV